MNRSLFIALAALASATSPDRPVPISIEVMLQWIVDRERVRWRDAAGDGDVTLVEHGVIAATLCMA